MKSYLAVDIGASSGRLIAAQMLDGKLKCDEIYRFENNLHEKNGHLTWDLDLLFSHILTGLKKVKELGLTPVSLGIDTWGCDYVLLDEKEQLCDLTYGYRDIRTDGIDKQIEKLISKKELYKHTGIQHLSFSTIFQLYAQKLQNPQALEKAKYFLMIPDYLNYKLTGVMRSEYTNATTTQLVNAETKSWDLDVIKLLGLKSKIFLPLDLPGTSCGHLKAEIAKELGFDLEVIMCASHDTASAVMACPLEDDHIYLSSGTWSLMGVENLTPNCSDESLEHNFTNEGGYEYRFRYLKNIMGMWILQNLRKELPKMSFEEIYHKASLGEDYQTVVDINDKLFLAPKSMKEAFLQYCRIHQLPEPQSDEQILYCAYNSLAHCYKHVVDLLEMVSKRKFKAINVIGGGCQDRYLNSLIKKICHKDLYAGPIEATAIGNLCVQLICKQQVSNLSKARQLVTASFDIKKV